MTSSVRLYDSTVENTTIKILPFLKIALEISVFRASMRKSRSHAISKYIIVQYILVVMYYRAIFALFRLKRGFKTDEQNGED